MTWINKFWFKEEDVEKLSNTLKTLVSHTREDLVKMIARQQLMIQRLERTIEEIYNEKEKRKT